MIVYLASYPRSGNTLTRNLIRHCFGFLTSSLYIDDTGYAGLGEQTLAESEDERFLIASDKAGMSYRLLKNGSQPYFTEAFRQELANSEDVFFLKTHELPFEHYFAGEYVFYIVRHPCATLWSYYNYHLQIRSIDISPEAVIRGDVMYGSWSKHIRLWKNAESHLGENCQILRYENLVDDASQLLSKLSTWTGLPLIRDSETFPDFEFWHKQRPEFYRSGTDNTWKSQFTPDQFRLTLRHHGVVMRQMNYMIFTQDDDLDILLEEHNQLIDERAQERANVDALEKEHRQLSRQYDRLEEKHNQLRERHDQLRENHNQQREYHNQLREHRDHLLRESEKLQQELGEQKRELERLRTIRGSLNQLLQSVSKRLK